MEGSPEYRNPLGRTGSRNSSVVIGFGLRMGFCCSCFSGFFALLPFMKRDLEIICRSEEHTSELQSHLNLVCRLLLEKKKTTAQNRRYRHRIRRIWQSQSTTPSTREGPGTE